MMGRAPRWEARKGHDPWGESRIATGAEKGAGDDDEAEASLTQSKADLKQAQSDRADAKVGPRGTSGIPIPYGVEKVEAPEDFYPD